MGFAVEYQTCRQGGWPDCWFIAALSGLAYHRPHDVAALLQEQGDGAVAVTFPGRDPVVVRPPEDAESRSGDRWVEAVEAAAGQATDVRSIRVLNFGEGITLLTGRGWAMHTNLTGMGFAPVWRVWSRTEWFVNLVSTAAAAGKVMVLGGTDGTWRKPAHDWITTQHCHALLGYEPEFGTCRIRNPYGVDFVVVPDDRKRDGYGPGEFWLTADETQDSFCGLAVEE